MSNARTRWRGSFHQMAQVMIVVALVGACGSHPAHALEAPLADLHSIASQLRKGGYVIFFRHCATEETGATDEAADLERCDTQRNLSAAGRAQAAAIGKSVKALGIPIGLVFTSPFCRAKDTAQLAFGRYVVNDDLLFVINMNAQQTERITASLRRMLSTPPKKGTNTVLISHSANLREAAGIFAKPEGVAYVFRPLPNGRFEPIARVLPEEWQSVFPIRGTK